MITIATDNRLLDHVGSLRAWFTEPEEADDVFLEVCEVDHWSDGTLQIAEGPGAPQWVAQIRGRLRKRKFETTTGITHYWTDAPRKTLRLAVDGQTFNVYLQNRGGRKDHAFFELAFRGHAVVRGQREEFESKNIVCVRNLPLHRAEVVFMAGTPRDFPGDPSTSRYFPGALAYWSRVCDNVVASPAGMSPLGAMNILDRLRESAGQRNAQPWGMAHIVSHGNSNTWWIRKWDSDRYPQAYGASNMSILDGASPFKPQLSALDEESIIVVRACEVGNDKDLLNAIKAFFGGNARVFAPRHDLVYRVAAGESRECLFKVWRFMLPGRNRPFPAGGEAVRLLRARYAAMANSPHAHMTDADWEEVVRITSTDTSGLEFRERGSLSQPFSFDAPVAEVLVTTGPGPANPQPQAVLSVLAKRAYRAQQEDVEVPSEQKPEGKFEDWGWDPWRISGGEGDTRTVESTGWQTWYYLYRCITVGDGVDRVPVQPYLDNPDHFGQSD